MCVTAVCAILLFVVELQLEVGQLNDVVSGLTVAETSVSPKYDDPYEENPVAAQCSCSAAAEATPPADVITAVTACDTAAADTWTDQEMSSCTSAAVAELKTETERTAVPVRSFELSAEYGGFFIDPAVTDKRPEDYMDQQSAEAVQSLPRVEGGAIGAGFYDEPWDLSTVTRSFQEQLCESSHKDVARAVADSCRPTTTDVYAQPQKHHQRINVTDPSETDGPSYGVLCERIFDNGFIPPPPLARRKAGNNLPGTWTSDLRPLDDYDVPWDQKKNLGGRTSKKQILFS